MITLCYLTSLSLVSLSVKRGIIITLTTMSHGVCYVEASAIYRVTRGRRQGTKSTQLVARDLASGASSQEHANPLSSPKGQFPHVYTGDSTFPCSTCLTVLGDAGMGPS